MKKLDWLRDRAIAPEYHGDSGAGLIMVTWGSSLGAGLDALAEFRKKGEKAALLHFKQVYPLNPADWLPLFEKARVVFVEGNYEGQFAQLVRRASLRYALKIIRSKYVPFLPFIPACHGELFLCGTGRSSAALIHRGRNGARRE